MHSRIAIEAASAELRGIGNALGGLAAMLTAAEAWTGADAARFAGAWHSSVLGPIASAASALDAIAFLTWEPSAVAT